jgi:hypothetical protein
VNLQEVTQPFSIGINYAYLRSFIDFIFSCIPSFGKCMFLNKAQYELIDACIYVGFTQNYYTFLTSEGIRCSNIFEICLMQYFHPDNMSSAEKLKIELAKVRDEFKMSDSDCGSARVQGKRGLHFSFIMLFHLERLHVSDFLVHVYKLYL